WRSFRPSVARGRRGHHGWLRCSCCVRADLKLRELAERGGFEPPKRGLDAYTLSRRAPSTTRTPLRTWATQPRMRHPAANRAANSSCRGGCGQGRRARPRVLRDGRGTMPGPAARRVRARNPAPAAQPGIPMSYLVLARKWRPRRFSERVGQEHVVRALSNALDTGRVHHAFLFTGT